jgi:hypothetical protein
VRAPVLEVVEQACKAVARLDPAVFSGEDCAEIAEVLARAEKTYAGARARAAARAAACGAHRSRGFADGAEWLARQSGKSRAEALDELRAGRALSALPATTAALAAGDISIHEAAEVARAQQAAPGSEARLLELAKSSGLSALKEEARSLVLGAPSPEELAARQHRARSFRHWRDAQGMWRFSGALPPTTGVAIGNRLDAEAARIRKAAGSRGREEPFEAHAADALVRLLSGEASTCRGRTDLTLVCDLAAFRRGHSHPGETCHIVGGGPAPVSWVRDMAGDAFLKAVLHDGTRIETVAHFGRHIPAKLRTALELGGAPEFRGAVCTEPGCGRRYGLQWDHANPIANEGITSFDNLQPLCYQHHAEKTERDRQAGLLGPVAVPP